MAERKTTTVTFNQDVYPYVAGDTVELDSDELKAVDQVVKSRDIKGAYSKGESQLDREQVATPTGDSEAEQARDQNAGGSAAETTSVYKSDETVGERVGNVAIERDANELGNVAPEADRHNGGEPHVSEAAAADRAGAASEQDKAKAQPKAKK